MGPLPPFPTNIVLIGPGTNSLSLPGDLAVSSGSTCLLAGMALGRIQNAGVLVMSNILIGRGYSSSPGGAVFTSGTLTVYNSTFGGNIAVGQGGIDRTGPFDGQPGYGGA